MPEGALKKAALWYAENLGWHVFPCQRRGKKPLTPNGFKDATTDATRIAEWWGKWPEANIGVACGASGLFVIDIDQDEAAGKFGEDSLRDLERKLGPLPHTMEQLTGRGRQLFFLAFPGAYCTSKLLSGLDLRGPGGYVILPPSIHPTGRQYTWELSSRPEETEVAELPDEWKAFFLAERQQAKDHGREPECTRPEEVLRGVPEGNRNDAIFRYAASLRARGVHRVEAEVLVLTAARNCTPPMDEKEALRCLESAWRYDGPEGKADGPPTLGGIFPTYSAGRFLDTQPPPAKWLLRESLVEGSVGFVIADGGTGKGFTSLQLGHAVACGISTFFNYEVSASGRVVYLTGEDAEEAVHHRLWAIHHRLCPLPESDVFRELLAENMAVVPLVGWDARFVKQAKGELVNTRFYQDTLKNLTAIEGLKLVIIDPVCRFFGADENDAGAATYFTSLLERIAKETGATVLACHHLNKANGRDGGKASLTQHSSRGSTGFMAAARWVLAMATITEGEAKTLGIRQDERHRYVVCRVAKKNLGPPEPPFYLFRARGGVLVPIELSEQKAADDRSLIDQIVELLRKGTSKGKTYTRRSFHAAHGEALGLGRTRMDRLLDQAILEGRIEPREATVRGRVVEVLTA